jgi:hypothetical protein
LSSDVTVSDAGFATRSGLHRVAAHVLARRRFEVSGRFGLRASPGGLATPAFGTPTETIRIAGLSVVREVDGNSAYMAMPGATLRELAAFAGSDIEAPFSCGPDTPPVGDPDVALDLDPAVVGQLADWYSTAWRALDAVLVGLPPEAEPVTIQLWPEHFDAATSVGLLSGGRINLGFSPGDGYEPEPYVYIGPWGRERPGDPAFWNAPFGALLRAADVSSASDSTQACIDFLSAGMAQASLSP